VQNSSGSGDPKADARQQIATMGLPAAQEAAVLRRIAKYGKVDRLTVTKLPSGDIVIVGRSPGRTSGFNEWEAVIGPDGATQAVIQRAYDDAGNLIHFDQKK
jgi:hypothetical protein